MMALSAFKHLSMKVNEEDELEESMKNVNRQRNISTQKDSKGKKYIEKFDIDKRRR